jgi:hypothetical protein
MQGALILLAITVIFLIAAAVLPAYSGLFVLCALGSGFFAGLVGLTLINKR